MAVGLVALAALLSGCGSSSPTAETEPSDSVSEACAGLTGGDYAACAAGYEASRREGVSEETSSEATEKATVSHSPPMSYVTTLHLKSEEGYTAKVMLRRGELERASGEMYSGTLTLGTTCQVNDETDAVAPFALKITNTTSGYAASPTINMIERTPHGEPIDVWAEIGYTEGPQCIEFFNGAEPEFEDPGYLGFGPTDPLGPGEFVSAKGFFIIHHFYSPGHPQGDRAKFRNVILELVPSQSGEDFSVAGASGVIDSPALKSAIAAIPGAYGGCLPHPPCPSGFYAEDAKEATQAELTAMDGSEATGLATFERVKNKLVLQVEATGLEPTIEGTDAYTIWLAQSPQKMLPLASTEVKAGGKDAHEITAKFEVPVEVLAYLATGTFDQIAITKTRTGPLEAALKAATGKKETPTYTGEAVLRGTITGPIVAHE